MNRDSEPSDELTFGERYPRPAAIEFGAAILIVGGLLSLVGAVTAATRLPAGTELVVAATIAFDVASVIVGVLIRMGRLWILDINFVAVVGFLDLAGAGSSGLALILGIADVAVLVILFLYRPWFERRAAWNRHREGVESDRP